MFQVPTSSSISLSFCSKALAFCTLALYQKSIEEGCKYHRDPWSIQCDKQAEHAKLGVNFTSELPQPLPGRLGSDWLRPGHPTGQLNCNCKQPMSLVQVVLICLNPLLIQASSFDTWPFAFRASTLTETHMLNFVQIKVSEGFVLRGLCFRKGVSWSTPCAPWFKQSEVLYNGSFLEMHPVSIVIFIYRLIA